MRRRNLKKPIENTVLVTGGAGFIGSHVVERLLARGDAVVCLDDFNDSYEPAVKRRNIAGYLSHPLFMLIEGDIRDEKLVASLFERYRFGKVLHLAARVGVRPSVASPEIYEDVNVRGTLNLLEHASRIAVDQFIFASSSSIYGATRKIPFSETDTPGRPLSPYAATKYSAETLCKAFHESSRIPTTILRFFSVYGPRLRPDMAIHRFVKCIRQRRAIPMFGDGTMARDYTYIDDIAQGILASLDNVFPFQVFNLGNNSSVTLLELIAELERACGEEIRIERLPPQPGDVERTCADISRARAMLGYNPATSIRQGLVEFVRWFDENTLRGSNRESLRSSSGI